MLLAHYLDYELLRCKAVFFVRYRRVLLKNLCYLAGIPNNMALARDRGHEKVTRHIVIEILCVVYVKISKEVFANKFRRHSHAKERHSHRSRSVNHESVGSSSDTLWMFVLFQQTGKMRRRAKFSNEYTYQKRYLIFKNRKIIF